MKKIFSILLTTVLLSGMLLPMAVSAADPVTISTTEETIIDFEDYVDTIVVNKRLQEGQSEGRFAELHRADDLAHNDALRFETGKYEASATLKFTIPITVTEAGKYTIVVVASNKQAPMISGVGSYNNAYTTAYLDQTNSQDKTNAYDTPYYYANKFFPGSEAYYDVELTAKNHNMVITFYASSNKFAFMLDCIKIRKKAPELDAAAITTIEFEDYFNNITYSSGVRQTINGTTAAKAEVTPGSDDHRFLKLTGFPNEYPYALAPNKFVASNPGSGQATIGSTVKKLNAAGAAFEDHELTEAEYNEIVAYQEGASIYSGWAKVTIPVSVKTAGRYTFDTTLLAPRFATEFTFEDGQTVQWRANAASAIEVYAGNETDGERRLHKTDYTRFDVRYIGDHPVNMATASTVGTAQPYDYMYRDSSIQGYKYGITAKTVFSAQLTTADEYITFKIPVMAYLHTDAGKKPSSNGPQITAYLDTLKISGPNVPNAISATTKEATVNYTEAERQDGVNEAVLALYNEGTLVSVEKWDTYADKTLSFKTAYTGTFDTAKVFMWEDYVNCIPKVAVKDLTVN